MRFTLFRNLRPRSVYDVFALLALIVAVGGTSAYAANTIRSTDIVDGEVKSADVANQDLTGGDIKDNSISTFDVSNLAGADIIDGTILDGDIKDHTLTDLDVGQVERNVSVPVGVLDGTSCLNRFTGINHGDDRLHVVLTPSLEDADGGLVYDARQAQSGNIWVHVCNFGGAPVDDGVTHFQLIGIRATR